MRDINKNKFRENINEIIEETTPTLKDIKDTKDKNVKSRLETYLLSNLLEKTIAHYSIGDDKELVKQSLLETIDAFENGFEWKGFKVNYGGVDTMIWIVSLAILCDISLEDFKRITKVIKRDNVKDKLLDFLVSYKDSDWSESSNNYIQEYPYKSIDSLLEETNSEVAVQKTNTYLTNNWYQGHDESYWHNSHKNALNLYFGYWAWEVAAIAKIKGIDDSGLQNQKYYPYDAVHW